MNIKEMRFGKISTVLTARHVGWNVSHFHMICEPIKTENARPFRIKKEFRRTLDEQSVLHIEKNGQSDVLIASRATVQRHLLLTFSTSLQAVDWTSHIPTGPKWIKKNRSKTICETFGLKITARQQPCKARAFNVQ